MNVFTKAYILLSSAALIYLLIRTHLPASPDIIRTHGIIVIDSAGRDRILIGAPFPYSAYRVRTDSKMVEKHWGNRYGKEYMSWYTEYHHGGNGILIMNADGFDQVLLGDDLADPNTGKRNGRPTGLLWNAHDGFERGGLGLNRLKENGQYRNLLGFDDESGEALHMGLLEDGSKMIRMAWDDSVLMIGRSAPRNPFFETKAPFAGIQLKSELNPSGYQINWIGRKLKAESE